MFAEHIFSFFLIKLIKLLTQEIKIRAQIFILKIINLKIVVFFRLHITYFVKFFFSHKSLIFKTIYH